MDIILAMLANTAAAKIEDKKWADFPSNIQKKIELSQNVENFALYRYIINNALRYPKEWIDSKANASVIASVAIFNQNTTLKKVHILQKSDWLSDNTITNEVSKTLKLASNDFPNTDKKIEIDLPLEWKIL